MRKIKLEKWKTILIDEEKTKYDISNFGNVRNHKTNKLLKLNTKHSSGYIMIRLYHNCEKYDMLVHRLVAIYFCKSKNGKNIVNHKNGDKHYNYYKNLEWVNNSENVKHAYDNKLINKKFGNESHLCIYDIKLIHNICKLMEDGYSNKEIINKFNIKKSLVTDIRMGRTWLNISSLYKIPKSEKKTTLTEKEIHEVCLLLENKSSIKEICIILGVSYSQKYIDAVKGIKYKKKFKDISKEYNF